jgi:hypothetical protein
MRHQYTLNFLWLLVKAAHINATISKTVTLNCIESCATVRMIDRRILWLIKDKTVRESNQPGRPFGVQRSTNWYYRTSFPVPAEQDLFLKTYLSQCFVNFLGSGNQISPPILLLLWTMQWRHQFCLVIDCVPFNYLNAKWIKLPETYYLSEKVFFIMIIYFNRVLYANGKYIAISKKIISKDLR